MSKRNELILTPQEAQERALGKLAKAEVEIELIGRCYGGVQADDKGLRQFVEHHLGLIGDDLEQAVARIKREEVQDVTPEAGEIKEEKVYGVSVFRRSAHGPYIVPNMVKACWKEAASRLGIFKSKIGSKGDVVEMGDVVASGFSYRSSAKESELSAWAQAHRLIHFYYRDGVTLDGSPTYESQKGHVGGPQGSRSIAVEREYVERARLCFVMYWLPIKFTIEHMADCISAMRGIGLGASRSLDGGKFELVRDVTIWSP